MCSPFAAPPQSLGSLAARLPLRRSRWDGRKLGRESWERSVVGRDHRAAAGGLWDGADPQRGLAPGLFLGGRMGNGSLGTATPLLLICSS